MPLPPLLYRGSDGGNGALKTTLGLEDTQKSNKWRKANQKWVSLGLGEERRKSESDSLAQEAQPSGMECHRQGRLQRSYLPNEETEAEVFVF